MVKVLLGHGLVEQAVLQKGAGHARRALGAQGDGALSVVLEGIHLLLDHVGGLAHGAVEQLGVLEHGSADLAEPEIARDLGQRIFQIPDPVALVRQDIGGASRRLGQ